MQDFGLFVDEKMDDFDFAQLPDEKFVVIEDRFTIKFDQEVKK